jgi:hypothetical protein
VRVWYVYVCMYVCKCINITTDTQNYFILSIPILHSLYDSNTIPEDTSRHPVISTQRYTGSSYQSDGVPLGVTVILLYPGPSVVVVVVVVVVTNKQTNKQTNITHG